MWSKGKRLNKRLYFRYIHPLPKPSEAEQRKIKSSLNLDKDHPFPRCPGKNHKKIREFEEKGNFSHSGNRRAHICLDCRCKHVAGRGTKHYGVGYCFFHDMDSGRQVAKHMAIALQQGYPLAPIKYQSDSEYVEAIRAMAEQANGRLDLGEELVLLRTHLQEAEKLWRGDKDGKTLMMKSGVGTAPMTDEIKVGLLVKLAEAISKLSKDTYVISESDYVHIDEIKNWLWQIWTCVDKNISKMITGETNVNDLKENIQNEFKMIPIPKTGRRKAK